MRALLLVLLMSMVAACSSSEPPHSAYYVVFFDPASAALLPEGRGALAQAVTDARDGEPTEIIVKGYVGADGSGSGLAEQRMQTVEQALLDGGVAKARLRLAPTPVAPGNLARLASGIVVQVQRGVAPPPETAKDEPEPLQPEPVKDE
jgi:hypothetical protein